jgi:hypothetical protein
MDSIVLAVGTITKMSNGSAQCNGFQTLWCRIWGPIKNPSESDLHMTSSTCTRPLGIQSPATTNSKKKINKNVDDAGEPAPEDFVTFEELSEILRLLLNRESNPGLPRLVGVNDKRKS